MVSFPAWVSKPGSPDALVLDQNSFNAAVGMGFSYPTQSATGPSAASPTDVTIQAGAAVTPSTVVAQTGSYKTIIQEIAMNRDQDDGRSSNRGKRG